MLISYRGKMAAIAMVPLTLLLGCHPRPHFFTEEVALAPVLFPLVLTFRDTCSLLTVRRKVYKKIYFSEIEVSTSIFTLNKL